MLKQLHPASWTKAVWLISPSSVDQLYNMNTAASNIEGMQVFSSIDRSHSVTSLFGIPVIVTEQASSLGSTGDLMLADFSQYAIGMRNNVTFLASSHEYFRRHLTSFKAIVRVDGQPLWDNSFNLRDSQEVSPFIALKA